MIPLEIDDLTEEQAKDILKNLVDQMDDLDMEDFFGSEGWRHMFGFEENKNGN